MALRIVPSPAHATSASNTNSRSNRTSQHNFSAPSAPGLPDTLRTSLALDASSPGGSSSSSSSTPAVASAHPLEARLAQWTATQQALKSQLLRRNYGIAEPLRRDMELAMVRKADSFRPSVLGPASGVHEEILAGRDAQISWEDVYAGQDGIKLGGGVEGGQSVMGWQAEFEQKVGMGRQ